MAEVTVAALEPRQRKWIENACVAFERGNFAYVVDATTEVLQAAPGCVPARRLQRAAQRRQLAKGRSFLQRIFERLAGRLMSRDTRKKPAQLLAGAETRSAGDPENVVALQTLAKAAVGLGWPETRVFALEAIRELEPRNRGNLLALGEAWLAVARPADTLKLAEEMLATQPGDSEARELMREASVAQTVRGLV